MRLSGRSGAPWQRAQLESYIFAPERMFSNDSRSPGATSDLACRCIEASYVSCSSFAMIGLSLELAETSYIPEYTKAKPAATSKKNNAATVATIVVTLERRDNMMCVPYRVCELLFSMALLTEQRRADYRFVI